MSKKEQEINEGRRGFLKLAAVAAPAAAATGTTAAAAEVEEVAGAGLRKTAHVKKYLDSARF